MLGPSGSAFGTAVLIALLSHACVRQCGASDGLSSAVPFNEAGEQKNAQWLTDLPADERTKIFQTAGQEFVDELPKGMRKVAKSLQKDWGSVHREKHAELMKENDKEIEKVLTKWEKSSAGSNWNKAKAQTYGDVNADLIASLEPNLRDEVLTTADDEFMDSLPAVFQSEAKRLTLSIILRQRAKRAKQKRERAEEKKRQMQQQRAKPSTSVMSLHHSRSTTHKPAAHPAATPVQDQKKLLLDAAAFSAGLLTPAPTLNPEKAEEAESAALEMAVNDATEAPAVSPETEQVESATLETAVDDVTDPPAMAATEEKAGFMVKGIETKIPEADKAERQNEKDRKKREMQMQEQDKEEKQEQREEKERQMQQQEHKEEQQKEKKRQMQQELSVLRGKAPEMPQQEQQEQDKEKKQIRQQEQLDKEEKQMRQQEQQERDKEEKQTRQQWKRNHPHASRKHELSWERKREHSERKQQLPTAPHQKQELEQTLRQQAYAASKRETNKQKAVLAGEWHALPKALEKMVSPEQQEAIDTAAHEADERLHEADTA